MKRTFLILGVALAALVLGVVSRQLLTPLFSAPSSSLPEFGFPDLSDRQRSVSEWRGKVLVLNFWATWCPPCREEMPELIALQKQYSEKGLQVVGIAIEDKEPVSEFLDFVDMNYPILIAGDAGLPLARQLGNTMGAVPYTLVVDRQGRIVYSQPGQVTKDKMQPIIEPLL
ncbi:TlpA family protein disulfide reductase [Methylosarcina fibrata]|uniref:TlpA family protein disulfide reductase n=1 Tax=Methylosarcina fibrata TaxID=105972 RepID=UPI00037DDBF5|nr:TlpA disulfide reductase family protein [Methylosarcina fibrata]